MIDMLKDDIVSGEHLTLPYCYRGKMKCSE